MKGGILLGFVFCSVMDKRVRKLDLLKSNIFSYSYTKNSTEKHNNPKKQ